MSTLLIRQHATPDGRNSTFYLEHPKSGRQWWPAGWASWSRADAEREADRLHRADEPTPETCARCHRRIDGALLRCQCPPMAETDPAALIEAALHRLLTVAGTARFDPGERRDWKAARADLDEAARAIRDAREAARRLNLI